MIDYDLLKRTCDENSRISATVVDDFIMYYAAAKDGLGKKAVLEFKKFRHVDLDFQQGLIERLMAQFIVHKVFRKGGLIQKYVNHADIKRRPAGEQAFLQSQLGNPWRFSYSRIIGNPSQDFYEMLDVFTGEHFLLYSQSVTTTLRETDVELWFNLVANNGLCWQSYGPVIGFQSFDEDDISFFATELNENITCDEDLVDDIDTNPVPYMMLLSGSRFPKTVSNGHELVQLYAEHEIDFDPDMSKMSPTFNVEYNQGIYRLSLNKWAEPPHYAIAYYDESQRVFLLHAMTESGFISLLNALIQCGIPVPKEAHLRVHLSMLQTAKNILKRRVSIDSHAYLFEKEGSFEDAQLTRKMNALMDRIIPILNSGKKPDLKKLSKELDLDYEEVKSFVSKVVERIEMLKRGAR